MTAVALGPYEHRGAYIGSELFDTTGTGYPFCPDCEHAPCVSGVRYAGGSGGCRLMPRDICVRRVEDEISERYQAQFGWEAWQLVSTAFFQLGAIAAVSSHDGARKHALLSLAKVASNLREQVQP